MSGSRRGWERGWGEGATAGATCQYCGASLAAPRAQGGQASWENVVAAGRDCNALKADRTPAQAGMPLRSPPRALAIPLARKLDLSARAGWSQCGFG